MFREGVLHQTLPSGIKWYANFLSRSTSLRSCERCKVPPERPEPNAAVEHKNWGNRPWAVSFHAKPKPLPAAVDFAVVGGGFTGLAAALWLKRLSPEKSVALLES